MRDRLRVVAPPPRLGFWYSHGYILQAADRAVTYCKTYPVESTAQLEKVLGEGRAAATLAMSMAKLKGLDVWVRLVDPAQQAPDAEVMYLGQTGKHQTMELLGVEVASYTKHSSEPLGEFILRTKLNKHHAYGEHTAIVIYVQRTIDVHQVSEAHEGIIGAGVPALVFLVGQADEDLFQVQTIYPQLSGRVDVRVSDALGTAQRQVLEVSRGMSKDILASESPEWTDNPFLAYFKDA